MINIKLGDELKDLTTLSVCNGCSEIFELGSSPIYPIKNDLCSYSCARESGYQIHSGSDMGIAHYLFKPGQSNIIKGLLHKRDNPKLYPVSKEHPFRIGFEIEKEDRSIYDKIFSEGIDLPSDWIVMRDTSLKSSPPRGFEIVTSAYNLTKDYNKIINTFNKYREYINADYTKYCGGHISISKLGMNSIELAREQKPMLCFFINMSPQRLKNININSYGFNETLSISKKHKPFHCSANGRMEIRVLPAVKSVKQIIRRMDVVRWFLENKPNTVTTLNQMIDKNGFLRKIYTPVYGSERWEETCRSFIKTYNWFIGKTHITDKMSDLINTDNLE